MIDSKKRYNSKILLFGEYTVILGSHAFAVPHDKNYGKWDRGNTELNRALIKLYDYLKASDFETKSSIPTDLAKLKSAIDSGLYFKSNIPIGFGVGSSGALSAGVLDIISKENQVEDLNKLKHTLALIESFFHGSSSGIDPLISWTNCGIETTSQSEIIRRENWEFPNGDYRMFLYDTGIQRKTSPLVKIFKKKIDSQVISKISIEELSQLNNLAIRKFLENKPKELFQIFEKISQIQIDLFKEMIPKSVVDLWSSGLTGDNFKLKLCGAGGGGYLLGITKKRRLIGPNSKRVKFLR